MIIAKYEDVVLREFEESDVPKKVEWINNPANNKFLHYDIPLQIDKTVEWFRKKDNSKRLDCIIEFENIPVGLIGLLQIDRVNSKAEYYITIGEHSLKRKGIATKATKAIIDYAFTKLQLQKVYLTVDSRNENAIHLYEKVGFKQEGYFVDDLFHTTNSEFFSQKKCCTVESGGKLYYEIENPACEKIIGKNSTPIQHLGSLFDNNVYIKRDDLIPFSFGGNKARKARLFFREIDAGDYDTVVTYGSGSSNHCRIIANMASARGIGCVVISAEETAEKTFNSELMRLFGSEIKVCPVNEVHDTIERTLENLRNSGRKPYFIAGGGHGILGTRAYVECYNEISAYESSVGVKFDYIFFASGTGTTHAGLVCGKLLLRDEREVVGISIARRNPRGRQVVVDSAVEYLREHLNKKEFTIEEIEEIDKAVEFQDQYILSGYGDHNDEIDKTVEMMITKYGIPLDTTYTGKAFCGMKKYIAERNIVGKRVLFIHTGGTPLFFEYLREK